jgi:hypothetical protein
VFRFYIETPGNRSKTAAFGIAIGKRVMTTLASNNHSSDLPLASDEVTSLLWYWLIESCPTLRGLPLKVSQPWDKSGRLPGSLASVTLTSDGKGWDNYDRSGMAD